MNNTLLAISGSSLIPLVALDTVMLDPTTNILLGVVLGVLAIAYLVGTILRRRPEGTVDPALVRTFNQRIRAWWLMWAILVFGFILGPIPTVVLFGCVSFWALREFITMTPTRRGDHRALFWTFFIFTPLQYVLVGIGPRFVDAEETMLPWLRGLDFYGLYSIMIPVYASLFIPARIAISGDSKRFLERSAKIQAGLLICVYALSFAPALLNLELYTWDGGGYRPWTEGSPARLLLYLVLIVQLNEVFQYVWGRLIGRHVIAPQINASQTWEGFIGGSLTTALAGLLLWQVTPFTLWGSACMALVIAIMGFAGRITMSAIKRDRGVTDYGTLVQGHAGVLDRLDSLCFAAPVFFHLTQFYLSYLPSLAR